MLGDGRQVEIRALRVKGGDIVSHTVFLREMRPSSDRLSVDTQTSTDKMSWFISIRRRLTPVILRVK